jgi:hypothetical protein
MRTKVRVLLWAGLALVMVAGALSPFLAHSSQARAAVAADRTAVTALSSGIGRTYTVPPNIGAAAHNTFTVNGLRFSIKVKRAAMGPNPWYLVVYCDCFFPTEKIFETDLATMFRAVAAMIHGQVIVEPHTHMVVPHKGGLARVPDIYYKEPFQCINELKIGKQSLNPRNTREARLDAQLLTYGYGTHSGQQWPIACDTWWFAPDGSRQSGPSPKLAGLLGNNRINIIVILYKHRSKKWPRSQPKKDEEREVRGFQSYNQKNAIWAAEHMFTPGPCVKLLSCLAEFHGAAS